MKGDMIIMVIWIEELNDRLFGKCWEISTETWDGAVYFGKDMNEAIKRFEEDKRVKATKVCKVTMFQDTEKGEMK